MTTFSLQATPSDGQHWLQLAQRCEAIGVDALLAPDHPGAAASPFVALAAAAAVTSTIELGSYVANAGVREPFLLAADIATLDVLSSGRARLGLGAGHTPSEWHAIGRSRPAAPERARRCIAVASAVRALLDGDEVTTDDSVTMRAARLDQPRPARRVPLTIGAANTQLLRWAGAHADIVGLAGLGRTRADGHTHDVRWRTNEIDEQVGHIADGAAGRAAPPPLEALAQRFTVTDDAEAAVADLAQHTGLPPATLLATPFVLAGTVDEIAAAINNHEWRWGITRYVVRDNELDSLTEVMARMR